MSEGDGMSARIDVNGISVAYAERGRGLPLVLLHGGLSSGAVWEPVASRLASEFRVITPDSRGHGHSTNTGETLSYGLLGDDVAALCGALGLEKPYIVGWSDGGQVALELAVRHPETAAAFIVGGAYPDFVRSGLRAEHRKLIESLDGEPDEEVEDLIELHADWEGLLEQTASMWLDYEGISDESISNISAPVLVLAADHDEFVSLDLSIALYRNLSAAELAVCPAASHESPMSDERSEIFATLIADFCRRRDRHGTAAKVPGAV
jgi:pimeloyl-ACP methyl ester carboxylesterase